MAQSNERTHPNAGSEPRPDGSEGEGERKRVEFYFWVHGLFRKYVELTMDLILVGLVLVAFFFIVRTIYSLGEYLFRSAMLDIAFVVSEVMFVFILIEVVRLLILYLEFHRVAVDTMVEITIVAVLREVILNGVIQTTPVTLGAISLFILVLGALLKYGGLRYTGPELYSQPKPFFARRAPATRSKR